MFAANSSPSVPVVSVPSLPAERLQVALENQLRGRVMCQLAGRPPAEVARVLADIARHEGMRAVAKRAVFGAVQEKAAARQLWLTQRCLLEECLDEVDPDWEDRWCEASKLERVPPEEIARVARGLLEPLEGTGGGVDAIVQRERAWDALEHLGKLQREVDAATARVAALMGVYFARKQALRAVLEALREPQVIDEPLVQAA